MATRLSPVSSILPPRSWESIREDFPILNQKIHGHALVYLDNAATSQKPKPVLEAIQRYYIHDNSNVHRGVHELSNRATSAYEGARRRAARFLNARSAHEIIFTRGTTEGINLVAHTWGEARVKAGDVILLTEMEHHSNMVPWQLLAQRTGAQLRYIPVTGPEGLLNLETLGALLTREVKLLACTHISNTLGTVNPVHDLCARARKLGITTLVDAAQSAGHLPLDVQQIDCDFLAFSGHKICGPMGIGVLFGRREILESLPPWQGGGEMIANVDYDHSTWNEVPHKFEAGTPHVEGAVGLHAALDYLDAIGRQRIFDHDQELAEYAWAGLSQLNGVQLFGPSKGRGGLISFLLRDIHAHDVITVADQYGVALRGGHHCNQPLMRKLGVPATARASFYFYNTRAEVDRLIEVVREIQRFFAHR
ncbi:MAG TPA: cysteine desulfurase [Candidatus Paceibacterota bacterium]|nr:cysteine desulfurase [Verrucomicrobiota bacterium]HRY47530.1 cysteine desulfurase [Candidatus Paceibacterota bacterium]